MIVAPRGNYATGSTEITYWHPSASPRQTRPSKREPTKRPLMYIGPACMASDPSGWIVPLNAPKLTFGPDTTHCLISIVLAHRPPGLFITVPVPAHCPLRGNPPGEDVESAVL